MDRERHVIHGHPDYTDGSSSENLWIIDLNDAGTASPFTEWSTESGSKQPGPHA